MSTEHVYHRHGESETKVFGICNVVILDEARKAETIATHNKVSIYASVFWVRTMNKEAVLLLHYLMAGVLCVTCFSSFPPCFLCIPCNI